MNSHGHISQLIGVAALAALTVTLGACGGSSPSSGGSSAPAGTSSAAATSPATSATDGTNSGAAAAIAANWEAFFSAKSSDSKRVALLQDGTQFASVIKSQSGSSFASLASAKVINVTVNSPTQATVKYQILLDGKPQLTETGTAVLQHATWKVGVASFCGLLVIENAGKTSGLPAACKTAA